ncbi:MAG TPA: hypothetical protein ENI23_12095 [bacterium]|nr:hypothetical protein [bacterium]
MKNQVREELAQKHCLNPDSPGYLNEVKARKLAGYSGSCAKSYGSKVFLMDRFVDALHGRIREGRRLKNNQSRDR